MRLCLYFCLGAVCFIEVYNIFLWLNYSFISINIAKKLHFKAIQISWADHCQSAFYDAKSETLGVVLSFWQMGAFHISHRTRNGYFFATF